MKKKMPTPQKLSSGKYRCQVMVHGERKSITDENPGIAQAKAIALQAGMIEQEEAKKEFLPLEQAIEEYVAGKEEALSPSTVRGYDIIKRNRFKTLMQKNVYKITKKDVQEAVSRETKEVSAKTVANAYGLIRPVLKEFGVDVFGVKLPQKVRPKKKYLQPEEVGALIEAVKGDDCEIPILLAVCLGMRVSEILGLCPDCIDLATKTITVRRTLVPDRNNKMVLKEGAKNVTSQRTIPLPDFIADKISAYLAKRRFLDLSSPLFRMHRDTVRKHVHQACLAAGITDTTTHGLRHTNAAVMKHLGIEDEYAMERGGWSSEATYKKTYSYVFESTKKDADKQIETFFENIGCSRRR